MFMASQGTGGVSTLSRKRSDSDSTKIPRRSRSRRELLETEVMFPDSFLQSMELFGPNGSMHTGERLKPIAIVLRPNEPLHRYEENFQYWLNRRGTTLLKLQDDPDEERRYRQTFAYFRATTAVQQHWDRGSDKHSNFDSKAQYRSRREGTGKRKASSESGRERKRACRGVDIDSRKLSSLSIKDENLKKYLKSYDDQAHKVDLQLKELESRLERRFVELEQELALLRSQTQRGDDDSARKPSTPAVSPSEPTQTVDTQPPDNISPTVEQYTCSDPIRMATELLQKAARVKTDPTRKRLVKDYTSLSSYVTTNEAAMRDSLAYVKGLDAREDAEITAYATRIKELAVRIDCKKRRRDAALAAVIAQEWKDQKSELVHQVERTKPLHASHENLTRVLTDLHQNGAEILALQDKLESCLQNAQSVRGTAFQELEIVSNGLTTALSKKSTLENLRQQLCIQLTRSNDAIFQLTRQLIDEAALWLH